MLDQTFSALNFQKISDSENRKGNNINAHFFPKVKTASNALKDAMREVKDFKKSHKTPYSKSMQNAFDKLANKRDAARETRDQVLENFLNETSKEAAKTGFHIEINKVSPKGKKPVYIAKDNAANYYVTKQLSKNIRRLYKVKQADRSLISKQLSSFLIEQFPYHIIRLDISKFYEDIDQKILLQKITGDELLSFNSVRLIKSLLYNYSKLAGTPNLGIPRGIGVSAYLAELYMRDIDKSIRSLPDIVFYARYVDDIVAVFAPSKGSVVGGYKSKMEEFITNKNLTLNHTKMEDLSKTNLGWTFEYLGYRYNKNNNSASTHLSDGKLKKYEARLNSCFSAYKKQSPKNAKAAYRLLIKRIQFLTSNTQLSHSKKNAYVGIFYSNPLLTDLKQLKHLDNILSGLCSTKLSSAKLKARIGKYSFENGFKARTYCRFHRKNEFKKIVEAWEYVE